MSRSGCVDGPGTGSSGGGGADGSRWEKGSGFGGEEVVETEGKGAGVKAVLIFAEIDGGVGGGMTSMVRQESLDDDFRC